jgi:hypothetical protein
VAAFRLRRHLLAPRLTAAGGCQPAVAEAICGIHAQVMGTTDLQVWARSASPVGGGTVVQALWEDRTLVRTWCMRGTLHLLTPAQLAVYSAAFDPSAQYTPVWYRAFEVTSAEMEAMYAALAEALADGQPKTRRELGAAVTRMAGERLGARLSSSWGELLKPAARRGLFVNGPNRGAETTYVRTDRWLGEALPPGPDPAAARVEWLRRYLRAYGPASAADYARWLGVRQLGPVKAALAGLGAEVTEVRVSGRGLYALEADLVELAGGGGASGTDGIAGTAASGLPARLLPGFDPYVLGHADRTHLLAAEQAPLVYRTGGWISPTVLIEGRIVGTWEHKVEGDAVAVRVTPFAPLDAAQRAGVQEEAERLAARFDRRLALYT